MNRKQIFLALVAFLAIGLTAWSQQQQKRRPPEVRITIESRVAATEQRLDEIEKRLDEIEKRHADLEKQYKDHYHVVRDIGLHLGPGVNGEPEWKQMLVLFRQQRDRDGTTVRTHGPQAGP